LNPLIPSLMQGRDDLPESLESWLGRRSWQKHALCRGAGTDAFIRGPKDAYEAAKRVCAVCQVQRECLEYALADRDLTGCWGGTTDAERREMRRRVA
jgi:WhiB family redox-sensing transcriptional regulator